MNYRKLWTMIFLKNRKLVRNNGLDLWKAMVVNFFDEHKIEKLSIEDGNGNKAKLARTKDNGIKIEYSSTILM